MKRKKMNLADIQGRLSRDEMKKIFAGTDPETPGDDIGAGGTCKICTVDWCKGLCYCSSGMSSCPSSCSGSC
jgi:hypothetical protein